VKNPGVRIIFEIRTETFFDNPAAKQRVQHRKGDLDAPEKITIHPVCAGQKDSVVPVVEEIENAAVLQKPPDDGAHANMFREAGDPGS
jgi:hypothetical protein